MGAAPAAGAERPRSPSSTSWRRRRCPSSFPRCSWTTAGTGTEASASRRPCPRRSTWAPAGSWPSPPGTPAPPPRPTSPRSAGYPPPAQVVGVLMNSIFLDLLDADALRLDRLNRLLERLPREQRLGLRPVKLLVLRPSRGPGHAGQPVRGAAARAFRFLTRGLGTRQTRSPDFLSLILFQPDYLNALMEIGRSRCRGSGGRDRRLHGSPGLIQDPAGGALTVTASWCVAEPCVGSMASARTV